MNLKAKSFALRKDIIRLIYDAGTGHTGGDFSVCDILNVLYNHEMNVTPENFSENNHDHFVLSKGHSVEALYCVLADKRFFPKEHLKNFSQFGSDFIGHPTNKIHGIEMNSGSLGHGLSVSVGMAIAERKKKTDNRTYVVLGDGELAEGSVWEGVMLGGHYQLDNLCAVVDRNRLQISGSTEQVMKQDQQEERWAAFGWNVISANGNDIDSLLKAFQSAREYKGKPSVIIAETTKGFGVSFMENQAPWHHRVPTDEELAIALQELGEKEAAYE